MNGSVHMNSSGFSSGITSVPRHVNPSDVHEPVFSPAVRFAPKELSPFQVFRLIVYWVAIIVIVVAMARSGFPQLGQVWSELPGHHSVK